MAENYRFRNYFSSLLPEAIMKNLKNLNKKNSGMTLIQLLVWLVIFGVLVSILFPGLHYRVFGPQYYPSRYGNSFQPGYRQTPFFWPRW
jgi:hypothetical protein